MVGGVFFFCLQGGKRCRNQRYWTREQERFCDRFVCECVYHHHSKKKRSKSDYLSLGLWRKNNNKKRKRKNEAMIGGGLMMRLLPRSWDDGNNSVAQKFGGVGGWLLAGCGS